ncbi:hypothetical protein GQ43DRAFT_474645 [Delitschia confertaspora ATCC 74209]|uniref:Uncharacterized protein n=1 Tax=Delitschia confertaspora ATCC 74209 TaxID=1513339 RepID=A0A9P4MPK2_9PLEO|nr:hypothetical protein GQ43DRAFT_474645 [Delitschia confertaspora ATCC 74209]
MLTNMMPAHSFALLSALFSSFPIASALIPRNTSILSTQVRNCNIPITAAFSANNSALNIVYAPSNSSLASLDTAGNTQETLCIVCTKIAWSDNLYGFVSSVDYDFWHRLDPGLLEQVDTRAGVEGRSEEAYFESSYIYGSPETSLLTHVHTTQPNDTAPLFLDSSVPTTSLCLRTIFKVMARGGVYGASGEIAKRGVFTQSVNLRWERGREEYCPRDRNGDIVCGEGEKAGCCEKVNGTMSIVRRDWGV